MLKIGGKNGINYSSDNVRRVNMDNGGLLVEPRFDMPSEYLRQGIMTEFDMEVYRLASQIKSDERDENAIIELIDLMNRVTKKVKPSGNDKRKFKRSASEILISKERTGCCDSSTLFTAMARSQGIPTMQIITFNKADALKSLNTGSTVSSGHFWVGCYAKNKFGENEWMLFNSDSETPSKMEWDLNDRNVRDCYAFAYVNDYRDVELDGIKIDSIENMNKIQTIVVRGCNLKLFKEDRIVRRDENIRERER